MSFYTYSSLDCNGEESKHSLAAMHCPVGNSGTEAWSSSLAHLRNAVDDFAPEVPLLLSVSAFLLSQKLANNIHFPTAFVTCW